MNESDLRSDVHYLGKCVRFLVDSSKIVLLFLSVSRPRAHFNDFARASNQFFLLSPSC